MTIDNKTLLADTMRGYQYAREEAYSELRRAQIDDDRTAAAEAVFKINDLDVKMQNLDRLYAQAEHRPEPQQRAPSNKFGLSPEEEEIARSIGGSIKGMTDEQRLERYAQQKQRYQQARASGEYRDDQGRVTR
ncbi:hypothetical protein [Bradyrhizobium sp. SZCCHNR1098]|uniref:hypothetical protein n=1 Tax=Bradyrhizobium sp. SZCCHNR1098 TaxID=3057370 RepID=UPI002916DD81|nr:hypothetical protein [Bradyrhizobium sp. SZCCHNR1098]